MEGRERKRVTVILTEIGDHPAVGAEVVGVSTILLRLLY